MKYDASCFVFGTVFSKLLKSYYAKNFPNIDIKKVIKEVKKEYKAIILRTPGLSKDNYMASNLKGAAYFFAIAKKVPDMTPELMNKIVDESMHSDFMMKINKKKREKGLLFSKAEQERMQKDSIRSQKSDDEMDWRFTYEGGKDEVSYTMTKCGVCKLAQQEDLLDYLPCMCHMDYSKYEIAGAKLIRSKTIANGDGVCDFHLVRIKPEEKK